MKTVIITGAGGFIGSALTKMMVESGVSVVAIDSNFTAFFPKSELITKVLTKISSADALLQNIPQKDYEAFFHFAWRGVNGPQKADLAVQLENINMTLTCATVANKLGRVKFLCSGTVAENAAKSLPWISQTSGGIVYGVAKHCTHLMLETYCKTAGQPFVWMQFSNIYGPRNKTGNLISYTLSEILRGKEASFGPALQPYDFIFVDDLLKAVYRLGLMKTNHTHYVISSGKSLILKEYLEEIGRICGKTELIKIGAKPDDGIRYTKEMFDNSMLVSDIGEYVSKSFSDGIRYTILNY